jgi:hypothetical protein
MAIAAVLTLAIAGTASAAGTGPRFKLKPGITKAQAQPSSWARARQSVE